MRRAVAATAAVAVTLALFFLMQLLIASGGADVSKPIVGGGVGLVTLLRDTVSGSVEDRGRGSLPPPPALVSEPPLPALPPSVHTPAQPEFDLATDIPAPEIPVIDALPFLGGPAVAPVKKRVPPAKPKVVQKKSRKQQSRERSQVAQAKAGAAGRGKSARSRVGKKASGTDPGSGGKRGGSRGSRGHKSKGNSGVVVLSRPKPVYPRKALRNREEGWVKVSFTITAKGTVANPKVVTSKPRRVFDRSALQAIRKWRFKPKTVGGKPVKTKATQLIEFKLARR